MAQTAHHTAGIGIVGPAPYPPKPKTWANGSGECGKCRAWWTGANTSHCGACHANFTGINAFDSHRVGQHEPNGRPGRNVTPGPRRCVHPATVGLVDAGRSYPCWGLPSDGERWWETGE